MGFAPRLIRTAIWLACFVAAFVVTHLPPSKLPSAGWLNDKVEHLIGYAMLAMATCWRFGKSDRSRIAIMAAVLVGLAAYAAVDELTQPWVGRSCEWGDWLADLGGAAIGLLLGLATGLLRRLSPKSRG
ncbi:MAG: VanZ family protein [Phycisphaerae bacterium]|nr:VanZ family protein [Phycisphaerae bacterium]